VMKSLESKKIGDANNFYHDRMEVSAIEIDIFSINFFHKLFIFLLRCI